MKEWIQNLIGVLFLLILGFVVLMYAMSINIPSAYKTFLGIPYQVNPEYVASFGQLMLFYSIGIFAIGMSIGGFATTYSVYKVERKLEQLPISPPPISMERKYCQYCGTENSRDTFYCKKCGNKFPQ